MKKISRNQARLRRKKRIRIKGSKNIPRLSVFRSNQRVFLQLVDDSGQTLAGVLSEASLNNKSRQQAAFLAGEKIGQLAKKQKITRVVFDRSGYKFHGRVKAVKEGAEKAGLIFKKQ